MLSFFIVSLVFPSRVKRVVVSSSGLSSWVAASKVTCVLLSFLAIFFFNFLSLVLCCSPELVLWARGRRIVVAVRASFRLVSACRPCCFSFVFLVLVLVLCSIWVSVLILDFGPGPSLVLVSLVFGLFLALPCFLCCVVLTVHACPCCGACFCRSIG